ncbi:MAG: DJ-1/PfpI family protein, partial [Cellulosilyticaceae bacterium]
HKYMSLKEIIEKDNDIKDEFKLNQFKFVHMPGGHAPMVDFVDNPYLGEVLNRIHENNILLSLICHAPVALSSAKYRIDKDGQEIKVDNHAYKGAHITVFGKFEELQVSIGGFYHIPDEKTRLEFYASDKLKEDGYNVDTTIEFLPKIIWDKDNNLLTGNGPQSIDIQADKLKELLIE